MSKFRPSVKFKIIFAVVTQVISVITFGVIFGEEYKKNKAEKSKGF